MQKGDQKMKKKKERQKRKEKKKKKKETVTAQGSLGQPAAILSMGG